MSELKIAILGPTASGKSELAMEVAKRINGTIVNGDPFQSYQGIKIGTGQPKKEEKECVAHIGYNIFPLEVKLNPFTFGKQVRVWANCKNPVLVTGSGLYLMGIWDQLTNLPLVPDSISSRVRRWQSLIKPEMLYSFLSIVDPDRAKMIHSNDRSRIHRALALHVATGQKPSVLLDGIKNSIIPSEWRTLLVLPSAKEMKDRISCRVLQMFANGWLNEVDYLRTSGLEGEVRRLQPIGYNTLFNGSPKAVDEIIHATQSYAKRQSTFFRNKWSGLPIWNPNVDSLKTAFELLRI